MKSTKLKLTEAVVAKFTCPAGKAQVHLWDTVQPGLGVRALPPYTKDGTTYPGKKTWVVHGRIKGTGAERRITLGDAGPRGVSLNPQQPEHDEGAISINTSARELARRKRGQMRLGLDPVAVEEQEAAADAAKNERKVAEGVTLRQVADHYIANKKTRNGPLKANTIRDINTHVDKSFATWAPRPIVSITRGMCEQRHTELATGGLTGKRPAPHRARGAFIVLRALINWAMDKYRVGDDPLIRENPVRVLKGQMAPPKVRTTKVPMDRVGHVWEALRAVRADPAQLPATHTQADALAFMLCSGARADEALSLTWDRVHLGEDSGSWHLPDPKNGRPVTFPLSAPARALLAARPRRKGCPWVFAARGGKGHAGTPRGPAMAVVLAAAGCHQTRHSLRATFTTLALNVLRIDESTVELITGHVPTSVTNRHYRETSDLRWAAPEVERIGAWIVEQAGIAAGRNVVKLPQKRRA